MGGSGCERTGYWGSAARRRPPDRGPRRLLENRISRDFWEGGVRPADKVEETRNWIIGEQGRTHGSIHSDWWVGSAAELATCGSIVVFPVTGWWKDRPHLERYKSKARYSLIVSLESDDANIDLYTPISQMVDVQTEIMA